MASSMNLPKCTLLTHFCFQHVLSPVIIVREADWRRKEMTEKHWSRLKGVGFRKARCPLYVRKRTGTSSLMSGDLPFISLLWCVHVLSVVFVPKTILSTRESMRNQNFHCTLRERLCLWDHEIQGSWTNREGRFPLRPVLRTEWQDRGQLERLCRWCSTQACHCPTGWHPARLTPLFLHPKKKVVIATSPGYCKKQPK